MKIKTVLLRLKKEEKEKKKVSCVHISTFRETFRKEEKKRERKKRREEIPLK